MVKAATALATAYSNYGTVSCKKTAIYNNFLVKAMYELDNTKITVYSFMIDDMEVKM